MPAGGQTIHPVVRRRNGRGATGRRRPARPSAPWAAGRPQHPVHAAVQAQRIVLLQGSRQQRVREVALRATGHVIGTEALPTSLLLMLVRGTRLQQVDNEGTTRSETAVVEPAGRLGADTPPRCSGQRFRAEERLRHRAGGSASRHASTARRRDSSASPRPYAGRE